jgi:Na+/melibiose symporter-like transporter
VRRRFDKWFRGYRSALSHRDLRLLLGSLLVSASGSWAYNVALIAFVYERTNSLAAVGAAGIVRFVPALLLSPYAGVLAERMERIRLMAGSDWLCAAWQLGLAIVAAADGPVALAFLFAGLTAATNVVYEPAVEATIPSLVEEDDLVAANALNGVIYNLVVVAGPAMGAGLLLLGPPEIAFTVNAGSFVASALIVLRIRTRSRPVDVTEAGTAGPLRQLTVGVRTILGLPAARTLVAFCALVSFVYGTDTVLFIAASEDKLGTGTEGFGYLLAGLGVGGLIAAPVIDRLSASRRLSVIIILGVAGYCLPTALLAVVHEPSVAFALQILRGGSTLIVDVLAIAALQRAVPSDQLARVFGVFFAFVLGAISLGALVTPPVVNAFGLDAGLFVMAFGPFALGLLGYPSLVAIDRVAAERAAALAPRVAILEQLGFFASASHTVLERLAGVAEEEGARAGSAIVREGEPAEALYVLADGEVEVTARGEAGEEQAIRTMSAPCYFGEIGVLEHIPRTATVTALTDAKLLRIEGTALVDALTSTGPSSSLMENARSRLALTHPSRTLSYSPDEAERV